MASVTASFNGKVLTEARIQSWGRAFKKASAAGNIIMGTGHHPQTKDLFYVVKGSTIYYTFLTKTGHYSCTCDAGQNGNACYHAAAVILQRDPALAVWIQAPYTHVDDPYKTVEMPVIASSDYMPIMPTAENMRPHIYIS